MPTMTKGQFAALVQRSPAAVSQWIAGGKLHGNALVGEGRHAVVNVDVALAQLGLSLDLGQQLAQPRPIVGAGRPNAPVGPPINDQSRLLKARADREELALQTDHAKAQELLGRWMVTERAEQEWSGQLAGLVQATETWLVTVAADECATAATGGAGAREIAKLLKDGYRTLRQRIADSATREAREVAELDEDEDSDESEDAE
jgi:hypothetical protein